MKVAADQWLDLLQRGQPRRQTGLRTGFLQTQAVKLDVVSVHFEIITSGFEVTFEIAFPQMFMFELFVGGETTLKKDLDSSALLKYKNELIFVKSLTKRQYYEVTFYESLFQ